MLRPATYNHLADVLRAAHRKGHPYHVVHFDGHGAYLDPRTLTDSDPASHSGASPFSRHLYTTVTDTRPGQHGYLLFEDPDTTTNTRFVDGPRIAALLQEAGVGVLVLNACRSAWAEAQDAPGDGSQASGEGQGLPEVGGSGGGVHGRVRAYGSLAAEVADAGVPGVVAMRFNVYVVTAAQFVADLYTHLLAGESLGAAATLARKALADEPTRRVGGQAGGVAGLGGADRI